MLQATLEPGKNELRGGSNDGFRVHENINNSYFLLPRRAVSGPGREQQEEKKEAFSLCSAWVSPKWVSPFLAPLEAPLKA